jgi:hypothetical protein
MLGSEPSRNGRQHGEEVYVVHTATAPQLGAVDDASDPCADERPGADGISHHQLADSERTGRRRGASDWRTSQRAARHRRRGRRWLLCQGLSPTRRNPAASSRRVAGITSPAGRPVERTGARGQTARPTVIGDRRRSPRCRIRHVLRGRPAVHPDGCSSSCLSIRSMPSRMKDEAFLYLVYGASSRIRSHVA